MHDRSSGFRGSRWLAASLLTLTVMLPSSAWTASFEELNRNGPAALEKLLLKNTEARRLAATAKGILVFPGILRAGFMLGAQIGDGVLLKDNVPTGYYNSIAASYGLQAGIQKYGYALFFLDYKSLANFEKSKGFEIGVGPTVVVAKTGAGAEASNITAKDGIVAFVFDQKGLMAGVGLKGSKITRIGK